MWPAASPRAPASPPRRLTQGHRGQHDGGARGVQRAALRAPPRARLPLAGRALHGGVHLLGACHQEVSCGRQQNTQEGGWRQCAGERAAGQAAVAGAALRSPSDSASCAMTRQPLRLIAELRSSAPAHQVASEYAAVRATRTRRWCQGSRALRTADRRRSAGGRRRRGAGAERADGGVEAHGLPAPQQLLCSTGPGMLAPAGPSRVAGASSPCSRSSATSLASGPAQARA